MIIDGTVCPVQRPSEWSMNKLFYSYKHKFHAIKYMVCVSTTTGLITYVSPPYPGSIHDKLALDTSGLLKKLAPGAYSSGKRTI
jgi:hypothetical protein